VQTGDPSYPFDMRKWGVEATVMINCVVDEQGRVQNMSARDEIGSGFAEAAMTALGQWTFVPGKRNGEAVAMDVTIPFRFALEEKTDAAPQTAVKR
jgi:periplasmic protein TonB